MSNVRAAMIGCGNMAQHHLKAILQQPEAGQFVALCDPDPAALDRSTQKYQEARLNPPQSWSSLDAMLADVGRELDAVFINTPHAFHNDQAVACLEAGADVLLEKPMAINADEARSLIRARDRTGRLLVVSFQGSLSPEVRAAVKMLRSDELGEILNIHAVVMQDWKEATTGTWRQNPALSGGGFMFDTGAHLLNTVSDLAGEEFEEVAAWIDNRGTPVDIQVAAIGRLKSGAMVTLSGCGDTIPGVERSEFARSDVCGVCTRGVIQTGIWGRYLRLQRRPGRKLRKVQVPAHGGLLAPIPGRPLRRNGKPQSTGSGPADGLAVGCLASVGSKGGGGNPFGVVAPVSLR